MAFFHGVKTQEVPTSLVSPVQIESGLIVAVGTAPVHLAQNPAEPNSPTLCYNYEEYVKQFGYNGDFEKYTLDEVARSQYALFGVSPTVFINVLDPAKHFEEKEIEVEGIINTPAKIADEVIPASLSVEIDSGTSIISLTEGTHYTATVNTQTDPADNFYTIDIIVDATLPSDNLQVNYNLNSGTTITNITTAALPYDLPRGATNIGLGAIIPSTISLTENQDYTAAYNSDGEFVITCLDANKFPDDKATIKYHALDPAAVTAEDIVGGVDIVTNKNKGLECIEDVYPKFRLVPGILISPKFSCDVTVAAIMKAKCTDINSVFNAIALVDIPTDTVTDYTLVAEYKNQKNLIDTSVVACWPKVSLGGVQYHLSTQLASLMNSVDSLNNDIPYVSPSNKRLQMDQLCLASGEEIEMTLPNANYLNSQGIVTGLNFANGWCAWGNRTSIYPSSTDVKDVFIAVRRFFYFLRNQLVLTYFQKVDEPANRRLLETIEDSVNIYLNGLQAAGVLVGSDNRLEFLQTENPTTDLLNGIIKFHLYITPAVPAEQIIFTAEFDPSGLNSLFE